MALANALLTFYANCIEQNVPRIAQQLFIVHGTLLIGGKDRDQDSVVFGGVFTLGLGFAGQYRQTFQAVDGLNQRKVFLAAKFG